MSDDTSPRRPPRRASSAGSVPAGRAEEPAPTADAAVVGEPTVVESHDVPAETAVLHSPADAAADAGPAHRADAPVDAASEPAAAESASDEPRDVAAVRPETSNETRAYRRPEPAAEPAPPSETVAAVPVSVPAETGEDRRSAREPEPVAESEPTSLREPRPEERDAPAFSAPAVAPAPPVPAPTEPVAESDTGPVAAPPTPHTVYVDSPIPPKKKGNRGFGVLMALLATIVYALVWAGVAGLIIAFSTTGDRFVESLGNFVVSPAYWGPVLVFALAMIVLSLVVNRGGWAWWIVGGFVVAVVVYFGYLGSALLTVATQITAADAGAFVSRVALTPLAIGSAVVAREVPIWLGAAAAARGRKVKAKNAETRANFDRESAERKAEAERARAGYAADDS